MYHVILQPGEVRCPPHSPGGSGASIHQLELELESIGAEDLRPRTMMYMHMCSLLRYIKHLYLHSIVTLPCASGRQSTLHHA